MIIYWVGFYPLYIYMSYTYVLSTYYLIQSLLCFTEDATKAQRGGELATASTARELTSSTLLALVLTWLLPFLCCLEGRAWGVQGSTPLGLREG